MTLDNLLRIGQLKAHKSSAQEIKRLIESAERNLIDANVTAVSDETRFDAAYKAILQSALAVLMTNGYRPDTKKPGHHITVIQSLPKTMGLAGDRVAVIDTLRRKRNLTDYTGEGIDEISLTECIKQAEQLLQDIKIWFNKNHEEMLQ